MLLQLHLLLLSMCCHAGGQPAVLQLSAVAGTTSLLGTMCCGRSTLRRSTTVLTYWRALQRGCLLAGRKQQAMQARLQLLLLLPKPWGAGPHHISKGQKFKTTTSSSRPVLMWHQLDWNQALC